MSGDIAYSGKPEEYAQAGVFFDKLIEELTSENAALVRVAFVPGNHDCDFSKPSPVRQLLMQHPRDLETRASGDVVQECTSVQKEYFRFIARYRSGELPDGLPRLVTSEVVEFKDGRIRLLLLNTAWLSKMHEDPGTSVFPADAIVDCLAGTDNAECTISVLHHPTNWLSPDNARLVRHAVDASSDFVLTGHEHKQDRYLKILRDGDQVGYFEAAVLQTATAGASAFAVMMLDLASASGSVTEYEWKSGMYQSRQTASDIPFRRSRQGGPFQIQPDHQLWLEDLGTGFNHSRAPTLRLNDLFVPPAVICRTVKATSETRLERRHEVDGAELFNHIFDAKKFIPTRRQFCPNMHHAISSPTLHLSMRCIRGRAPRSSFRAQRTKKTSMSIGRILTATKVPTLARFKFPARNEGGTMTRVRRARKRYRISPG